MNQYFSGFFVGLLIGLLTVGVTILLHDYFHPKTPQVITSPPHPLPTPIIWRV